MLVKYVVHSSESIVFTQGGVPRHGATGLCHRGGHQAARRPAARNENTEYNKLPQSRQLNIRDPIITDRNRTEELQPANPTKRSGSKEQ